MREIAIVVAWGSLGFCRIIVGLLQYQSLSMQRGVKSQMVVSSDCRRPPYSKIAACLELDSPARPRPFNFANIGSSSE